MKSYGCLLKHWQPMTSILFRIARISSSLFKWNYVKKEKSFLNFFPLMESTSNFKHFRTKMIIIANVLLILQNVKDLVRPYTKKRHFRTSFDSKHVKGSKTLVKSAWLCFHHIFPSLWGDMIWKTSPLANFVILGVFVKALTANGKYPVRDCENLQFPI